MAMDSQASEGPPEAIAVVGMAGRFPGARDISEYWENLIAGRECLTEFHESEIVAAGVDRKRLTQRRVRSRGVLRAAEYIDAAFFGILPREAELMDPQQRVFLELAWEALENAGYDPERAPGPIGVFAGAGINTYFRSNLSTRPDLLAASGEFHAALLNEKDFLATRVAYKLNLRGPAVSIQTACSTSLVAVCQACQSLLNYECDVALAGAVAAVFPQCHSVVHEEGGMIAPDGHCRPFDDRASGTVFSDGAGIVVLRRMSEAREAGDHILGVIKGFAVNNDGADKAGFTAPSVNGQAEVIRMAQEFGGTPPASISYVEAHGTATPLGDPIEAAALALAFREGADQGEGAENEQFCGIGSVKSNVGHLDAAAGVAGLIKTVLALQHGEIPPTLHFTRANASIDFESSPFFVVDRPTKWPRTDRPRRAGVSSFGIGGTNAHVVLEEAPLVAEQTPADSRGSDLLILSAKTPAALDAATANLKTYFKGAPAADIADIAFTLQVGRREFSHRRTLVCRDVADAVAVLEQNDGRRVDTGAVRARAPIVFMFPGQGSQLAGAGRRLYATERVFRQTVAHCAECLRSPLDLDLRTLLFPEPGRERQAAEQLKQTRFTQPALFALEMALARLWMSWGVEPAAMIGHSVGEYTAACVAGVFSLEDGLRLVAERGRLVQEQPRGAMLAVMRSAAEVTARIDERLSIAAINAPALCVVSGPAEAVAALESELAEDDVPTRRLPTSHAFHSAMMEPATAAFAKVLNGITLHAPATPYISNVTASWIQEHEAMDTDYWIRHLREPVRFAEGADSLLESADYAFLEVGPGSTLTTLMRRQSKARPDHTFAPSLPVCREGATEWDGVLQALASLWRTGVGVDWGKFQADRGRRKTPLPSYPFERRRYWIEPASPTSAAVDAPPIAVAAALRAPEPSVDGAAGTAETRETSIREMLREELKNLFGLDPLSYGDSTPFLDLGMDSLLTAQFSQAIERTFQVRLSPQRLSGKHASVATIAACLAERASRDPSDRPSEAFRLSCANSDSGEVRLNSHEADALAAVQEQLQSLTAQVEGLARLILRRSGDGRGGGEFVGPTDGPAAAKPRRPQ